MLCKKWSGKTVIHEGTEFSNVRKNDTQKNKIGQKEEKCVVNWTFSSSEEMKTNIMGTKVQQWVRRNSKSTQAAGSYETNGYRSGYLLKNWA